ncbi:SMI1/KNR4 family protein [Micromonospora halotolerans]|uniref:SMI1/KNR4 family protein n=1 Tax=Micromonospora halotolerans TaxID=709879 RepID=A0ABZ0A2Q8_9ACTN|nr:SMI1/KNR4 family protein [Micromonospora halotolerans]WNM41851.1 SMI1/KNR4 family protein [Micromonospora halotolerans]
MLAATVCLYSHLLIRTFGRCDTQPAEQWMDGVGACIVPAVTRSDWSDVREQLDRLAAAPGVDAVFGSESHGWKLEPPLSADDLAEAEAQWRVRLPNEYRSFLLEVGRGGVGPA